MPLSLPMIGGLIMAEFLATFNPLPWQIAPWRDKSEVLLLTGSAGGGKSRLAAEKVNGYCWKYPNSTWLILRKAREWTWHSIVPFFWKTILGQDKRVRYNRSEGAFYYPNGSTVYSGGMLNDDQREAIRSIGGDGGLDGAWMEEGNAFTKQDREEIEGRIRHTAADWQQLIITTNPDAPTNWIYTDLMQGGGASVYYSAAKDNPYNAPAYLSRLAKMTGIMKDRLVDGKWTQAEGVIYDEFDPLIHMLDPDQCPPFVNRYRVVDFGFTNPFVCQWWGEDADGRLYRYREIYYTRRLVEDHAKQINQLSAKEKYVATPADHDAEDRATLERHGISTTPANKAVKSGIQAVKERLRVQEDGRPRLYLVRNALVEVDEMLENDSKPTCAEQEIVAYAWPKGIDGKAIKEEPVKMNDHAMDATRYIVMHLDFGGAWDVY